MTVLYIDPTDAREIYPDKSVAFIMRCGEDIAKWQSVAADANGDIYECDDGNPNFYGVALAAGSTGETIRVMRGGFIQCSFAQLSDDAAVDHVGQAVWSNVSSTSANHGLFNDAEPTGTTADELADDAMNSYVGKLVTQYSINGVIKLLHVGG